jgi:hypothetical protein
MWPERLFAKQLHPGRHTIHDDPLHHRAVAPAASENAGAVRNSVRHQSLHALDGGSADHRADHDFTLIGIA